eukprot:scpid36082/ scgid18324/ 
MNPQGSVWWSEQMRPVALPLELGPALRAASFYCSEESTSSCFRDDRDFVTFGCLLANDTKREKNGVIDQTPLTRSIRNGSEVVICCRSVINIGLSLTQAR